MRAGATQFRPFTVNGRRTTLVIMLVFTLYTGLSLVLSTRAASRSNHQAGILEVAARQRTLTERYAKEVLLGLAHAPSAATPVAADLKQSVNALINGGVAPEAAGDDDMLKVVPLTGTLERKQLEQERSLINDLVASGEALLAGKKAPVRLTGHEHYARNLSPLQRLIVLTGLTSNVALDVTHSVGEASDQNAASVVSLQRLLAALGLAVFGLLGWALVASTRRRNAHFRSLVASTTDLVLSFTDGQCRYASNSVLRMIDCTEAAVLGNGILDSVHPDDEIALFKTLRKGRPAMLEFRLRDAQGNWRALEANVTDLREDRDVRGIVLNARDVTERHRVEAERESLLEQEMRANERLRELDVLKDDFVALVSHEVRTPLTSILGYLELFGEEELTEEQRTYTTIIGRNSDRLLRLTTDLLFIAQIDDGKLTVEHDDIDLGTIIAQALTAAAPTAIAGGIELTGDESMSLPLTGDDGRLAQLLDNLISNAVKFTPAGGTVDVTAGSSAESVWLEVRDTGIGIAELDQEQLFNKFFRTRAATAASIQGTGLGLAISKAIVQAHGGSIEVESAEGVGTTFRVELPVGLRAVPAVAVPALTA